MHFYVTMEQSERDATAAVMSLISKLPVFSKGKIFYLLFCK